MRPDDLVSTWSALRADYDAGHRDWDGLVKACADLRVRDADGRWWTIDATGRLLVYDDVAANWIEVPSAKPPATPEIGRASCRERGS
jgi:hypothetical protein